MYYKIKSIKHTGRKGPAGTERTDGRYPLRVGRTVELDPFDVMPGCSVFLNYVKEADGSDYFGMLRTSFVTDVIGLLGDELFTIYTCNSVYELEKVEDETNGEQI